MPVLVEKPRRQYVVGTVTLAITHAPKLLVGAESDTCALTPSSVTLPSHSVAAQRHPQDSATMAWSDSRMQNRTALFLCHVPGTKIWLTNR
jgi:hypothetical protein